MVAMAMSKTKIKTTLFIVDSSLVELRTGLCLSVRGRKVYATCRSGCNGNHKPFELPISIGTELRRVARYALAKLLHHVLHDLSPLNHFVGRSHDFPDS